MALQDLPPLQDALKLDKPSFYELVKNFLPHSHYCGSVFLPEKMTDWCTYLKCDGNTCVSDVVAKVLNKGVTTAVSIGTACKTNTTIDPILKFNGSCFDEFFCVPASSSKDYHYVVGIFVLIMFAISVVCSLIYTKGFYKEYGRQNTAAMLLVMQAISDVVYLVLSAIGVVSVFTYHSELAEQLRFYASFNVYVVLYVMPLAWAAEALSLWLLVMISLDRFNYLIQGSHSRNILTKRVCGILLAGVVLVLIGFAVLRLLSMRLEALPRPMPPGLHRLKPTVIGADISYRMLLLFWLKMPVEDLLPLCALFVLLCMLGHQLLFGGSRKAVDYEVFQEFRLTKAVCVCGVLLLLSRIPRLSLHILQHEIGIGHEQRVRLDLVCQTLGGMYHLLKSVVVYQYMCPLFSSWLQNRICLDSAAGVRSDPVLRARLVSLDGRAPAYSCNGSGDHSQHKTTVNTHLCGTGHLYTEEDKEKETFV